jgi:fatty-acyl-CoA synthase
MFADARIVAYESDPNVLPGDSVGVGEVGELIVRGPHCTPGYWNRPSESAKRIRHGWLHTGDLFSRDADGYYFFQGRADYMIVSGGENIYPMEVEAVLQRCPGVREAAVAGLPDDRWGQAVAAFVVRDNHALNAAAIDDYCLKSDTLARYKRPRRIFFVEELPRNGSGKVLLRDLVAPHL